MKAIKMQIQKSSRWLVILLAAAVVILTSMVVANATQTITTPNAVKITYSLAAGASSAVITPATNTSVLVMGCCTTTPFQGTGHVSLLHSPSTLIAWTGVESHSGVPDAITAGGDSTPGRHIVFIDAGHVVDVQVASADTIRIHNGHPSLTLAGNVTLVW
jgi:hypothetical protein